MKRSLWLLCAVAALSGCTSKPVATTKEYRADPAQRAAYGSFVAARTEELQRMGGPFKNPSAANMKAQEEAAQHFGEGANDQVTTTWQSEKEAGKAQAQQEFTDKLDDLAKDRQTH